MCLFWSHTQTIQTKQTSHLLGLFWKKFWVKMRTGLRYNSLPCGAFYWTAFTEYNLWLSLRTVKKLLYYNAGCEKLFSTFQIRILLILHLKKMWKYLAWQCCISILLKYTVAWQDWIIIKHKVWFGSSILIFIPYQFFVFSCQSALLLVCCSLEFFENGLDRDCIITVGTFLTA